MNSSPLLGSLASLCYCQQLLGCFQVLRNRDTRENINMLAKMAFIPGGRGKATQCTVCSELGDLAKLEAGRLWPLLSRTNIVHSTPRTKAVLLGRNLEMNRDTTRGESYGQKRRNGFNPGRGWEVVLLLSQAGEQTSGNSCRTPSSPRNPTSLRCALHPLCSLMETLDLAQATQGQAR